MTDRKPLPGKFIWFEHASNEPKKAQTFYREVFGWRAVDFPFEGGVVPMIFAGETPDTMIGSYSPARGDHGRWLANVSVADVDAAVAIALAEGGEVIEPAHDLPGVGRAATIVDPGGAEIALFKNTAGDPPDGSEVPVGRFLWNELHTKDPEKALAFYEKVVGFEHTTMNSPAGPYHIVSASGRDRGGITSHLPPGVPSHWLPYVHVDDVDATVLRARELGAAVPMGPEDVLDVGRIAVLRDPTGAPIAVMKPRPRAA